MLGRRVSSHLLKEQEEKSAFTYCHFHTHPIPSPPQSTDLIGVRTKETLLP